MRRPCVGSHAVSSTGTFTPMDFQSMCGLGVFRCRCAGNCRCRIASTTFIIPTTPEAASG